MSNSITANRQVPLWQVIKPAPHEADYGNNSEAFDKLSHWLECHPNKCGEHVMIDDMAPVNWKAVLQELESLTLPPEIVPTWHICCKSLSIK